MIRSAALVTCIFGIGFMPQAQAYQPYDALQNCLASGEFAQHDGLDDYGDNFTRFEPLGNTITADMIFHANRKKEYKVGKLDVM